MNFMGRVCIDIIYPPRGWRMRSLSGLFENPSTHFILPRPGP
jgi:hypothetical protein